MLLLSAEMARCLRVWVCSCRVRIEGAERRRPIEPPKPPSCCTKRPRRTD